MSFESEKIQVDIIEKVLSENELPDEVELFPFQVGGHKHGKGRLALGILKHKNGHILKPLYDGDHRSYQELSFYETVNHQESDQILQEIRVFLPNFFGTLIVKYPEKSVKYLCLEDVTKSFKKPSILDVKIGARTYELTATKEKIMEQKSKFLYGESLGIRIIGMKVYNDETNLYTTQEKSYLRSLCPSTITVVFLQYLTPDKRVNSLILGGFLHRLRQIQSWFSRQRRFALTASSVLLVYEGRLRSWRDWDAARTGGGGDSSKADSGPRCPACGLREATCAAVVGDCPLYLVKMIDFAHTTPSEEEDANYTFGLHRLIGHFESLLRLQLEH